MAKKAKLWDVVIVGGGPAGLTAAIYLAREAYQVLVLEKEILGGMLTKTHKIDNYSGFADGVEGLTLAQQMEAQAKNQGAVTGFAEVVGIEAGDGNKLLINLSDGRTIEARSALIATGTKMRKLGLPGEEELIGRKIHFCATCDAAFYKQKPIAVIGGGNSAVEEAIFLAKFASKITMLTRDGLGASQAAIDQLNKLVESGQVEILEHVDLKQFSQNSAGDVVIDYQRQAEKQQLQVAGVFEFVGMEAYTSFLQDSEVKLSDYGFVLADEQNATSLKGVFVAGDVRDGAIRQATTAVGDGTKAALVIRNYLETVD